MKRLFEIVEKSGKPLNPRVFAETKKDAKEKRGDPNGKYMIARGPDHMRFPGAINRGER